MSFLRPRMARVVAVVTLAACSSSPQHLAETSPAQSEGTSTILQAAQEIGAGRYGVADRILFDYAARYPASPEGRDVMYWRALYKLDPANPNAAPREALDLLDSYVAAPTGTHKVEAQTLRRLATTMEARATAASGMAGPPKTDAPKPEDKARDEELQRVKDELAKANAELERIKRRLARPKP